MMNTRFFMPTEVIVGAGCLDQLPRLQSLGKRAAIVCGRQSARESGALGQVLGHYADALVLDGFPENPGIRICEGLALQCRAARVDCIIGLGGGSAMDGAKAIALLATNEQPCAALFDVNNIQNPALPTLQIPTTAGTGSEVTPYSVLVDEDARRKKTLKHPSLFPQAALLDPRLTLTLSRDVTMATGLDALSQAMEGMVSNKATPVGDVLALECCRLIRAALPRVLEVPDDEDARGTLLYAAMLSGIVIAHSGTTMVHGMGYYYTLEHGIAHGVANALLLPPAFQWNARHVPHTVMALAEALGHPCAQSTTAEAAVFRALHAFYEEIGFAAAARDHGVPLDAAARYAASIAREPSRFKNQVGEMNEADVAQLYQAAWSGAAL